MRARAAKPTIDSVKPWAALGCLLALACGADGGGGQAGGEAECLAQLQAQNYQAARSLCATVYEGTASSDAALATATAHFNLGEPDQTLAWVERLRGTAREGGALILAAQVHDQRGEKAAQRQALLRALKLFRAAGDGRREAWILYSLAFDAWQRTAYREALERSLGSAAAARRAGDGELEILAVELEYGVLAAVGDPRGAQAALRRLEALAGEAGTEARARRLHTAGDLWLDAGRLELARDATEKALAAASEGEAAADSDLLRACHLNLTRIALRQGDTARARRHLEAAEATVLGTDQHPVSLDYFAALLAAAEGSWPSAAAALEQGLAQEPAADWAWDLRLQLGRTREAMGDLPAAAEAYGASLALVEGLRQELALSDLQPWLLARKREPFEALFALEARRGRWDAALEAAERGRARTFLEALVRDRPPAPVAQASAGARAAADEDAEAAEAAALARLRGLEALLPSLAEEKGPVRSGAELRSQLQGIAVLSYFRAGDDLWVYGGRGPDPWRRLEGRLPQLEAAVEDFLADLDAAAKADALGQRLLPEELLPPAGETLYLVTDGPLGRLPFAALRVEGRWLVERHPLVFVPSLEALARLLERPRRIAPAEVEGSRLLLGDPSDDLPGARQEVLSVAKLLGSRAFLGKEASRRRLFTASSPDLLHLATHSGLTPEGPWLMLADGRLRAAAILRRRWAPRLAVLASCASAARPGQEMWGSLGAFFLAAGSESVVATLYSVPDESTRELVLRFYEQGGLEQPAVALARAQRILLGEGRPASQWAPFVVLGLGG